MLTYGIVEDTENTARMLTHWHLGDLNEIFGKFQDKFSD